VTWAPPYGTTSDLAGWLGITDDPGLALPIEAASRAIDQACGRQFGLTDSQSRTYQPKWHRDRWHVDIDDVMGAITVETVTHDGTVIDTITDYLLTPRNAVPNGKPYTGLEFHGNVSFGGWSGYAWGYTPHHHHAVKVTGQFGWLEIPEAIKLATQIQAGRLYERRDTPAGQLIRKDVDDTKLMWGAATELDADVLATVRPYIRHWAAA
jgi:hypothetical protein